MITRGHLTLLKPVVGFHPATPFDPRQFLHANFEVMPGYPIEPGLVSFSPPKDPLEMMRTVHTIKPLQFQLMDPKEFERLEHNWLKRLQIKALPDNLVPLLNICEMYRSGTINHLSRHQIALFSIDQIAWGFRDGYFDSLQPQKIGWFTQEQIMSLTKALCEVSAGGLFTTLFKKLDPLGREHLISLLSKEQLHQLVKALNAGHAQDQTTRWKLTISIDPEPI